MTHPLRPVSSLIENQSCRNRRFLQIACLGVALLAGAPAALAQDQEQPPQPPQQPQQQERPQPSQELLDLVEQYYHFAAVANYEAARAYGQRIVEGEFEPTQVVDAFREIHARRRRPPEDLDRFLLTWQQTEPIADVTRQIVDILNQGRVARATDPEFIGEQLERLSRGSLPRRNALEQLRNSGEYAVPVMLRYLMDPDRAEFHFDIRRAMSELGPDMLNPLLTATQMEDPRVLSSILLVLGDLGYDAAVPYLLEQLETSEHEQVRQAAQQALQRIDYSGPTNAAEAFYVLAERFYYGTAPIQPNRRLGTATIWSWGGQQVGLIRTDVPPQIFDEVMAMRAAGKSLALGEGMDESLALWLASNYRREGELREGQVDRTQPEGSPDAAYYGTQAGTRYLQMVLARADADRQRLPRGNRYNTADVSLRAIKSLQEIVGRGNIGQGETPLTNAMNFPDRRVRMEAAFALAQALPVQGFAGQEQVVPLLADALSQTGEPAVLVIMPDRDQLNSTVEQLRENNFRVQGATSVSDGTAQARQMPAVDVVVIDSQLGDREVDSFLASADASPRLGGAAKLVLVQSQVSRYEGLKDTIPTLATTTARSGEQLVSDVETARLSVGGLAMDAQAATELALRSGDLLRTVGVSQSVFRLETGEQFLLAALDDPRPEVQMLAGEVVALLDSRQSQPALLEKALSEETEPLVKISIYDSLATSAKLFGPRLESGQVDRLLAAAADRSILEVQAAAAEAVGALNLPADQARQLIIQETRASESPESARR